MLSQEAQIWLARAFALIECCGDSFDRAKMRHHVDHIASSVYGDDAEQIEMILYRRLAVLEMASPAEVRGIFIPVGQGFTALQAVAQVLGAANTDLLIVDPYFSFDALNDYVMMAKTGVLTRLLLDEKSTNLNNVLKVGIQRWRAQFGSDRPLEARVSPAKTLHDRLIVVDGIQTFLVSQSLKDLALKSPASLQKADYELHLAKLDAYEALWKRASTL